MPNVVRHGAKWNRILRVKCTSYYPVIMTQKVAETTAFYVAHFGFSAVFEADWYLHLQPSFDPSVNLAILDGQHRTIPEQGRGAVSGLRLNFEGGDPDPEYARLKVAGLPIAARRKP
jgi:catechol 2,3-dioxygenase-like lactoylglutathione lyase family enzyme